MDQKRVRRRVGSGSRVRPASVGRSVALSADSFAPNGKIILYATEIKGRGILAAVSSDGRTRQRLSTQKGDIREPAWGPLPKWRRKF